MLCTRWVCRALVAIAMVILAGCTPGAPEPPEQQVPTQAAQRLKPAGADERLIVDRYANKLVLYDIEAQAVLEVDDRPQTFVYTFAYGESDLVAVGSSDGGVSSIGRIGSSGFEPILDLPHAAAFPLAVGERTYFAVNTYTQAGVIATRAVAYLRDGELVELPHVTGAVTDGAAVDGELWYTTYEEESDSFTLHSVAEDDPDAQPRIRREGLADGTLFAYDGRVITEGLFTDGIQVGCDIYCALDAANDRLYVLEVAGESLTLDAISLSSGEVRQIATGDVLDLVVESSSTTVLMRDRVLTIGSEDLP